MVDITELGRQYSAKSHPTPDSSHFNLCPYYLWRHGIVSGVNECLVEVHEQHELPGGHQAGEVLPAQGGRLGDTHLEGRLKRH